MSREQEKALTELIQATGHQFDQLVVVAGDDGWYAVKTMPQEGLFIVRLRGGVCSRFSAMAYVVDPETGTLTKSEALALIEQLKAQPETEKGG